MTLRSIFSQPDGTLRAGWRILIYAAITAAAVQIAVWVYYAAGGLYPGGTLAHPTAFYLTILDALLWAAALLSAFLVLRLVDRRNLGQLGFAFHSRIGIEVAQGLGLAFAMMSSLFAVEAAARWIRVSLSPEPARALALDGVAYLSTFAVAAALEETLSRGYIFQCLVQGTGKIAAVAITSGLFGCAHAMNPHATPMSIANTILAGVWLAVAYLKTRSLWLPTAMHLGWNFSMGYLFGSPVSGLRVSRPLLSLQQGGPDWATGGVYGPEGGLVCTFILAAGTFWILKTRYIRPADKATALWSPPLPDASDQRFE